MSDASDEESEWFWRVIDSAHGSRDTLRSILSETSKEDIRRFQGIFEQMAVELQDEPYDMFVDPDESEDGLQDIANWVVSQGQAKYNDVLANPSHMPHHVEDGDKTGLYGVGFDVYYRRFNEILDDF